MTRVPLRRKQHLVSKGYQRNFADGGNVSLFDSRTGSLVTPRRSINENWTLIDFASVLAEDGSIDDSLEIEFARDERQILNIVRELSIDTRPGARHKEALDRLAAIHLVRSVAFAHKHEAVVNAWARDDAQDLATNPKLEEVFIRDRGRPPEPGELATIVSTMVHKFAQQPDLLAQGMRHGRQSIPEILAKSSIQLVGADVSLPGFILPANPIVHGRLAEGVFGFGAAGAVGDADLIVVPINRRLVGFYSRRRLRDVLLKTKNGVRAINSILIHAASSEVICHPEDALEVSRLFRSLDRFPPASFDTRTLR